MFKKFEKAVIKRLLKATEKATGMLELKMEEECPVDSGYMRKKVERETVQDGSKLITRIGVDEDKVHYVGYVVFGTRKMSSNDFITRALILVEDDIEKIIESELGAKHKR